ncbi:MAG: hypothetical protein IPI91_19630 [Flavobacteriales bacterium]|nr:hypothetical protein [Flavobacteriales bacterium]
MRKSIGIRTPWHWLMPKNGQFTKAVETANLSIGLAKEAKSDAYVEKNNELLISLKGKVDTNKGSTLNAK